MPEPESFCQRTILFTEQNRATNTIREPVHHLSSRGDGIVAEPAVESHHKIYKLRDALSDQSQFDEVYTDTPPVLNFYSLFALIASQKCLTPFD